MHLLVKSRSPARTDIIKAPDEVSETKAGGPTWQESTPCPDADAPAWRERAVSRSVERGPLQGRGTGAALPRRRVRADRREGHDRVHDPGGRRPVEAVAAQLLRVLRRQGRARARAVRGDGAARRGADIRAAVDARVGSARAAARLHDLPARVVRSQRGAPQARHASSARRSPSSRCTWPSSTPNGCAPRSRRCRICCASSSTTPRTRASIHVDDTRRAATLVQQTVMYSWFGNRLVDNPESRAHRRGNLAVLLAGLARLNHDHTTTLGRAGHVLRRRHD